MGEGTREEREDDQEVAIIGNSQIGGCAGDVGGVDRRTFSAGFVEFFEFACCWNSVYISSNTLLCKADSGANL